MKYIAIVLASLLFVGCGSTIVKTEIVTVDKPVPYVPKPPVVPPFVSKVDQLTNDDVKDPGKVGQAYKYDMTALRQLLSIYVLIIAQYDSSSQNFDEINAQIDKIYADINSAQTKAADEAVKK